MTDKALAYALYEEWDLELLTYSLTIQGGRNNSNMCGW